MAASGGAKRTGQRARDQARAAYLKARGIVRTDARCPICHGLISLKLLPVHVVSGCRGGR